MKQFMKKVLKIPVLMLYQLFLKLNKTDKRIILFESNLGRNYSGNPRFIYEELVKRGLDQKFQCYFIFDKVTTSIPGHAKKVKRISIPYFYLFSKAGFWVSDTRMPTYLKKKKDMVYLQTWHGTPLKKLALDMKQISMEGEADLEEYKREFVRNVQTWDYLISQNSYSSEIFQRAFAFHKRILEIGYPRNDILINQNNEETIIRLKDKLMLPQGKKLLLYAPTWRDNEHLGSLQYKFSSGMDYGYLRDHLPKDYIILVKAHYLVGERPDDSKYGDFVYFFDSSYDIAELYLVADMLITDYSSVMFDYSLLKRPMLFYCYDLEQYKEELRGFYFDYMAEAPGPVALTMEELAKGILSYDFDKYNASYKLFSEKYNHCDRGDASKQVVDLLMSLSEL